MTRSQVKPNAPNQDTAPEAAGEGGAMNDQFADVAAFPLCWPEGWPRTKAKKSGPFRQTTFTAIKNLLDELAKMGAKQVVISTSIPLRRDGLPLSKPPVDGDHGAAVYFIRKGSPLCLACDQYFLIEDNVQALAKTIEAMRGIERWGSTDLLDRAFTGFAALPQSTTRPWFDVLGIPASADKATIKSAYRALAVTNHPDNGGDPSEMAAINAAYEEATK